MKLIDWLIYSSEDPKSISLTVRGILMFAVPLIVELLREAGVMVAENQITLIITKATAILALILTLFGLGRKLYNTFGKREVVAFTVEKKKVTKKKK